MILATPFAVHDTNRDRLSPTPLHRAVCAALLPWLDQDAALVLEGSVQRHHGRLRIHARLIDRETRRIRLAFRFDATATPDAPCDTAFAHFAAALVERVVGLGIVPPVAAHQARSAPHAGTGSI